MNAKDVHSILTKKLTPAWREAGFRRLSSTPSAWYAQGPQAFEICRIYLDRHFGYVKPLGGRMFLRAWRSEVLAGDAEPVGAPLTLGQLLPSTLLTDAAPVQDRVRRKILAGDWDGPIRAANEQFRALLTRTRDELASAKPGETPLRDEMAYVDSEDVAAWADFLCGVAPHLAVALRSRGGGAPSDPSAGGAE